jgi:mRNA-degrading endonuclease RelE of RelBE toxin-antitoxin system
MADNPARLGKPLRFELEGLRSARRGDYRVIYRIDPGRHRVEIVAIEHRSDAYRSH